jgi:hypothetical protein
MIATPNHKNQLELNTAFNLDQFEESENTKDLKQVLLDTFQVFIGAYDHVNQAHFLDEKTKKEIVQKELQAYCNSLDSQNLTEITNYIKLLYDSIESHYPSEETYKSEEVQPSASPSENAYKPTLPKTPPNQESETESPYQQAVSDSFDDLFYEVPKENGDDFTELTLFDRKLYPSGTDSQNLIYFDEFFLENPYRRYITTLYSSNRFSNPINIKDPISSQELKPLDDKLRDALNYTSPQRIEEKKKKYCESESRTINFGNRGKLKLLFKQSLLILSFLASNNPIRYHNLDEVQSHVSYLNQLEDDCTIPSFQEVVGDLKVHNVHAIRRMIQDAACACDFLLDYVQLSPMTIRLSSIPFQGFPDILDNCTIKDWLFLLSLTYWMPDPFTRMAGIKLIWNCLYEGKSEEVFAEQLSNWLNVSLPEGREITNKAVYLLSKMWVVNIKPNDLVEIDYSVIAFWKNKVQPIEVNFPIY